MNAIGPTHALSIGAFVGLESRPRTVCGLLVREDTQTTMEANQVTCPECVFRLLLDEEDQTGPAAYLAGGPRG